MIFSDLFQGARTLRKSKGSLQEWPGMAWSWIKVTKSARPLEVSGSVAAHAIIAVWAAFLPLVQPAKATALARISWLSGILCESWFQFGLTLKSCAEVVLGVYMCLINFAFRGLYHSRRLPRTMTSHQKLLDLNRAQKSTTCHGKIIREN